MRETPSRVKIHGFDRRTIPPSRTNSVPVYLCPKVQATFYFIMNFQRLLTFPEMVLCTSTIWWRYAYGWYRAITLDNDLLLRYVFNIICCYMLLYINTGKFL